MFRSNELDEFLPIIITEDLLKQIRRVKIYYADKAAQPSPIYTLRTYPWELYDVTFSLAGSLRQSK